jgi:aspartyl protease family protein
MAPRSPLTRPGRPRAGPALCALVLLALAAQAGAQQIHVLALFPGKAMIAVDGERRVLSEGERSPEGVLLVRADPAGEVVEVEIDGRRETLGMTTRVGGGFAERQVREARVARNNSGGYTTVGSINGRMVDFLVDTGASAIALSERHARGLGLQYRLEGEKIGVETASGATRGYSVVLDSVRVGDIQLRNVRAVVIQGDYPAQVLLGMTFLDRVQIENRGRVMVLRSKLD